MTVAVATTCRESGRPAPAMTLRGRQNEQADRLAKAATREESEQPPQRDGVPWYLTRLALKRAKVIDGPPPPKWAETGRFTRKIDAAFHLGKSAEMYRQLNSMEAVILTQLRTGKTFLNEYLHKIKATETAACDCGCIESVAHFLFACRRWRQQRAKLRQQHGQRFGELSYALGGYSSRQEGGESIDGPIERWKPSMGAVDRAHEADVVMAIGYGAGRSFRRWVAGVLSLLANTLSLLILQLHRPSTRHTHICLNPRARFATVSTINQFIL